MDLSILNNLVGQKLPNLSLKATDGRDVQLNTLSGRTVLFAYPRTSPKDGSTVIGWDQIPGAKGCTAQNCGFRDKHQQLLDAGATQVFGLSTQNSDDQAEAVVRLHLPFHLLSDADHKLHRHFDLPTLEADGVKLLHRFAAICVDDAIEHVVHSLVDTGDYADVILDLLL
ncbi:MAG: peroxiredoxin [Planktomarina sp.]